MGEKTILTWTGPRQLAVILANFSDLPPGPDQTTARTRIFGNLRSYFQAVSYNKADLTGDVFGPYTLGPIASYRGDYGPAVQQAVAAAGSQVSNYLFACVILNDPNGGGWAYYGSPPTPGAGPLNTCWVSQPAPLGVDAMENIHAMTWFGDLYGKPYSPGPWDNMDCSCGTHPSSFTKMKLGWLTPAVFRTKQPWWWWWWYSWIWPSYSDTTLNDLAHPAPFGTVQAAVIRPESWPFSSYFMVEARFRSDQYERPTPGVSSGIPGEGVVIYYIDESSWPPVHLETRNPLANVGDLFADSRGARMSIVVIGKTASTFAIKIMGPGIYRLA